MMREAEIRNLTVNVRVMHRELDRRIKEEESGVCRIGSEGTMDPRRDEHLNAPEKTINLRRDARTYSRLKHMESEKHQAERIVRFMLRSTKTDPVPSDRIVPGRAVVAGHRISISGGYGDLGNFPTPNWSDVALIPDTIWAETNRLTSLPEMPADEPAIEVNTFSEKSVVLLSNTESQTVKFAVEISSEHTADDWYDFERGSADFVLVLDDSGSLDTRAIEQRNEILGFMRRELLEGDRIGIVKFSHKPITINHLLNSSKITKTL
jgi:hypothetical protein